MCIKSCLTFLIPLFQFPHQEAEAIPSDSGRGCQCIASSEGILDAKVIINLFFSGVHFSKIVTGHHEDWQFFKHLTLSHKCQCVNINLLATVRCKDDLKKILSSVKII